MKLLEIVVDLDGMAAGFFEALIPEYNRLTGESVSIEDFKSWDMGSHVKQPSLLKAIYHQPGFFMDLAPLPGAIEALRELQDAGHTLHIVSSGCTPHAFGEKAMWCRDYLPFIPLTHVTVSHRKGQIHGDVILDDGPHNARNFRAKNPGALILGIEWPHARSSRGDFDVLVEDYNDTASAWRRIVLLVSNWSKL